MLPDRIRTSRLVLRRQRAADAHLVKEAIDASLKHLKASVAWARFAPMPLDALTAHLSESEAAFHASREWTYSIFDQTENEVLGAVALEPGDEALTALIGPGSFELGYWLRANATGQGFATEATVAVVDAAVRYLEPSRIAICHDPANIASAGVPHRAGFRKFGVVPMSVLPGRQAADGSLRPTTQVWVLDIVRDR